MTQTNSTIFISDTHGDTEFFKAIGSLTHSIDGRVLLGGDIGAEKEAGIDGQIQQGIQQIQQAVQSGQLDEKEGQKYFKDLLENGEKAKTEAVKESKKNFSEINDIAGNYKNGLDYFLGNHDPEYVPEILTNGTQISNELVDINGYKFAHVDHYSMSFFNDVDTHSKVNEKLKDGSLEEMCKNADFLATHELADSALAYVKKGTEKSESASPELIDMANKYNLNLFGGHVHNPKMEEEDGRVKIRTCCGQAKDKRFYVADHLDNNIYEIKYDNMMKWHELQKAA